MVLGERLCGERASKLSPGQEGGWHLPTQPLGLLLPLENTGTPPSFPCSPSYSLNLLLSVPFSLFFDPEISRSSLTCGGCRSSLTCGGCSCWEACILCQFCLQPLSSSFKAGWCCRNSAHPHHPPLIPEPCLFLRCLYTQHDWYNIRNGVLTSYWQVACTLDHWQPSVFLLTALCNQVKGALSEFSVSASTDASRSFSSKKKTYLYRNNRIPSRDISESLKHQPPQLHSDSCLHPRILASVEMSFVSYRHLTISWNRQQPHVDLLGIISCLPWKE